MDSSSFDHPLDNTDNNHYPIDANIDDYDARAAELITASIRANVAAQAAVEQQEREAEDARIRSRHVDDVAQPDSAVSGERDDSVVEIQVNADRLEEEVEDVGNQEEYSHARQILATLVEERDTVDHEVDGEAEGGTENGHVAIETDADADADNDGHDIPDPTISIIRYARPPDTPHPEEFSFATKQEFETWIEGELCWCHYIQRRVTTPQKRAEERVRAREKAYEKKMASLNPVEAALEPPFKRRRRQRTSTVAQKVTYTCHHAGSYASRHLEHIPLSKHRFSEKQSLKCGCSSRIVVNEMENGTMNVCYYWQHQGHNPYTARDSDKGKIPRVVDEWILSQIEAGHNPDSIRKMLIIPHDKKLEYFRRFAKDSSYIEEGMPPPLAFATKIKYPDIYNRYRKFKGPLRGTRERSGFSDTDVMKPEGYQGSAAENPGVDETGSGNGVEPLFGGDDAAGDGNDVVDDGRDAHADDADAEVYANVDGEAELDPSLMTVESDANLNKGAESQTEPSLPAHANDISIGSVHAVQTLAGESQSVDPSLYASTSGSAINNHLTASSNSLVARVEDESVESEITHGVDIGIPIDHNHSAAGLDADDISTGNLGLGGVDDMARLGNMGSMGGIGDLGGEQHIHQHQHQHQHQHGHEEDEHFYDDEGQINIQMTEELEKLANEITSHWRQ